MIQAPVVVDKACFGSGNSNQETVMFAGPISESQSVHMRWTEKARMLDGTQAPGTSP